MGSLENSVSLSPAEYAAALHSEIFYILGFEKEPLMRLPTMSQFFPEFDICLLEKYVVVLFLQILEPSLLILQVHWISEWRGKNLNDWLSHSSPHVTDLVLGMKFGAVGFRGAACLRKLQLLSLCVWIVSLWIFFAWGHSHPQVLSCIFFLW